MEEHVDKLRLLCQATIVNYLPDINLDSETELYEQMIQHLFHGDFDDVYFSEALVGLDFEEKVEIHRLVQKFKSLCFYQGDIQFWTDSIEGVSLMDMDLICTKLIDHYEFLLGLAKDGGEKVLKQLLGFQKVGAFKESSVIDHLRNIFENDKVLKNTLLEISKEDGLYAGLTDEEKAVLCLYPEGVLYIHKDGLINKISPYKLIQKIQEYSDGYVSEEDISFEKIGRLYANKNISFEDVIFEIYCDSKKDIMKR